jgi:flagellar biosynthesis protein FlhG
MSEVYSNRMSINSAFYHLNENLSLLADISGSGELDEYSNDVILATYEDLINVSNFDLIIIDAPAGIGNDVLQSSTISDLVAVVVTDEPTSLLDGYGLVKLLSKRIDIKKLNLIINNVIDFEDAEEISMKMNLATDKFLSLKLDTLGYVPYDRKVRYSIIHQELFTESEIDTEVSKAIIEITDNLIERINISHFAQR